MEQLSDEWWYAQGYLKNEQGCWYRNPLQSFHTNYNTLLFQYHPTNKATISHPPKTQESPTGE